MSTGQLENFLASFRTAMIHDGGETIAPTVESESFSVTKSSPSSAGTPTILPAEGLQDAPDLSSLMQSVLADMERNDDPFFPTLERKPSQEAKEPKKDVGGEGKTPSAEQQRNVTPKTSPKQLAAESGSLKSPLTLQPSAPMVQDPIEVLPASESEKSKTSPSATPLQGSVNTPSATSIPVQAPKQSPPTKAVASKSPVTPSASAPPQQLGVTQQQAKRPVAPGPAALPRPMAGMSNQFSGNTFVSASQTQAMWNQGQHSVMQSQPSNAAMMYQGYQVAQPQSAATSTQYVMLPNGQLAAVQSMVQPTAQPQVAYVQYTGATMGSPQYYSVPSQMNAATVPGFGQGQTVQYVTAQQQQVGQQFSQGIPVQQLQQSGGVYYVAAQQAPQQYLYYMTQ